MKTSVKRSARLLLATGCIVALAAPAAMAGPKEDLLREVQRQQSPAELQACANLKKAIAAGADVALAVRTAIELGFAPCNVIRCAVDAGADPATIAAIFADDGFEPNFCYFTFAPESSHDPLPPPVEVRDRGARRPPQLSPYLP